MEKAVEFITARMLLAFLGNWYCHIMKGLLTLRIAFEVELRKK